MSEDLPPRADDPTDIGPTLDVQAPDRAFAEPARTGVWSATPRLALQILVSIWRGQPIEALRTAETSRPLTGGANRQWLAMFAAQALLGGLLAVAVVSRTLSEVKRGVNSLVDQIPFAPSVGNAFGIPAGTLFEIFLVSALIAFTALVLRVVTMRWTFNIRGDRVPFAGAANILATASSVLLVPLAAALVCTLFPGAFGNLLLALVGLLGAAAVITAEVVVYVGLNRTARFSKSAAIPHATLTVVWFVLCGLVVLAANTLVLASALS